jgi:hypothetical protein
MQDPYINASRCGVGDSAPLHLGTRADLEHLEVDVKAKDNLFLTNCDDFVSSLVPSRTRAPEKYRGRQEVGVLDNAVRRKPPAWRTPPREAGVTVQKTRSRLLRGWAIVDVVGTGGYVRTVPLPQTGKKRSRRTPAAAAMEGGKCSAGSMKQERPKVHDRADIEHEPDWALWLGSGCR